MQEILSKNVILMYFIVVRYVTYKNRTEIQLIFL